MIYSSNYARTLQTAKYFAENRNMIIHVDERFNERKLGVNQNDDLYLKQYFDENIKNPEGESRKEVRERMKAGLMDAIKNNQGKSIAISTHGAALTFLLMEWCKLEYIDKNKRKCLSFKGRIFVDKIFDAPEVFKIKLDERNEILSIENLEFDSLKD